MGLARRRRGQHPETAQFVLICNGWRLITVLGFTGMAGRLLQPLRSAVSRRAVGADDTSQAIIGMVVNKAIAHFARLTN